MDKFLRDIRLHIEESVRTKQMLLSDEALMSRIARIAGVVVEAYKAGHKTLWAGNGGSAADAQHMAGELVNKFTFDRPGLAALSLSTDTSIITAVGNDYGFDRLHLRQVAEPRERPGRLPRQGHHFRCHRRCKSLSDGRL